MGLFGFDENGNPVPMGEMQAKADFAHKVQELTDLIVTNTTQMPLRNPVSLDRGGYWIENYDGTSTDLGRVAFAYPIAQTKFPEGISDQQKLTAIIESFEREPILALVTSPGADGFNHGHTFYFNFYGEIVGYSKAQIIGGGINSIDMGSEVLKCPSNYIGPAKTLLLEAAAKIKEKHQLASKIEAGLNIGKEEPVTTKQTYQAPQANEQPYQIPQASPVLPQPSPTTTTHILVPTTSTPEMPAQSNTANYVGIGSAAVIGTLLLAYVANRLYHKKK